MRTQTVLRCGVAALCLGMSLAVYADHEKESKSAEHAGKGAGKSVRQLMGQTVVNDHEETLGKIHDVIVDPMSGRAPYAIIALNSSISSSENKVAVPLRELKCTAEGKPIQLNATPAALRTATKNLSGEWSSARDAEWSQKVDGFYASSYAPEHAQGRDLDTNPKGSRTFVRDPAPKGGELLITPDDAALAEKICNSLEVVQVRVENGVTHLYGSVPSDQARQDIEARVRGVQGVRNVESHLRVRPSVDPSNR